jgi:hypothetical protein
MLLGTPGHLEKAPKTLEAREGHSAMEIVVDAYTGEIDDA